MEPVETTDAGADATALHQALVDQLKAQGRIRTARVESAFRAVPRHLFLPGYPLQRVYSDKAIDTKRMAGEAVSSSSQPSMMAVMLEQLGLRRGHRVLEIGAGTGYNAALMAHIVGKSGQVITVDIDEDIVDDARAHLAAAGFAQVQAIAGDGGLGYAVAAPYDRIILTVGAWDIAPAWREQLESDGRLLLPLSIAAGAQASVAFDRADDHLMSVSLSPCGFMMLRGAFAGREQRVRLGTQGDLHLITDDPSKVDADTLSAWLAGPSTDRLVDVRASPDEIWYKFTVWVALHEPRIFTLVASADQVASGLAPRVFRGLGHAKFRSALGMLGERSLCLLLERPRDEKTARLEGSGPSERSDLVLRSFGPDHGLGSDLGDHVAAWDTAGRPSIESARIRAYPVGQDFTSLKNESLIKKRWTVLALDWK